MAKALPAVLVITDRSQAAQPLLQIATALFAGGCRWLSLREPDLSQSERIVLLYRLVALGERAHAIISVHADYDAAMITGAGGVHLPRHGSIAGARTYLGARTIVGISAHDRVEAEHALAQSADYITLSPIFTTSSKPGYGPAIGLEGLREIAAAVPLPIYALGGVDAGNAAACIAAGAAGVAVMGAAMRAPDPEAMIRTVIATVGNALATSDGCGHSHANATPAATKDEATP